MKLLSQPSHFHPIFLLCLSSFPIASLIHVYYFFIEFRFETKTIAKSCSKWVFPHFYILFWPYTYPVNGISNPLSLYISSFHPTPVHHASRWKFLITLLPFQVFPFKITNLLTPRHIFPKSRGKSTVWERKGTDLWIILGWHGDNFSGCRFPRIDAATGVANFGRGVPLLREHFRSKSWRLQWC